MLYVLSFVAGGVVTFYALAFAGRRRLKAAQQSDAIKNLSAQ